MVLTAGIIALNNINKFLVAFAKITKTTISFVLFVRPSVSVCPSFRMEKLGSYWRDPYLLHGAESILRS